MTIHILVEGPSERAFIGPWSRRFLKAQSDVLVHAHQGKGKLPQDLHATPDRAHRGLLDQLPAKLRAFASLDPSSDGVLILVDADSEDCKRLNSAIKNAASMLAPSVRVEVRIAIEETEAFYLGDLRGLKRAFPDADMARAARYKSDSICGTWEEFGRVVRDGGGNKVAWASAMAPVLTTAAAKSRSPSFKKLCSALKRLATPLPRTVKRPKRHRHVARTAKRR